jgi:hypothetical protein
MAAHPYENTHSSDLENVRLARTGIGTSDQIATQSSPFRPGGAATEPDGILGNLPERLPGLDRALGDLLQRLPGLDRRLRGLTRVICVRATRTSAGSGVEIERPLAARSSPRISPRASAARTKEPADPMGPPVSKAHLAASAAGESPSGERSGAGTWRQSGRSHRRGSRSAAGTAGSSWCEASSLSAAGRLSAAKSGSADDYCARAERRSQNVSEHPDDASRTGVRSGCAFGAKP